LPDLDLTVFRQEELYGSSGTDSEWVKRRETLFPIVDHGVLVAGLPLAPELSKYLPEIEATTTIHMPYVFSRRARRLPERLAPVDVSLAPDPDDEFFGYTRDHRTKLIVSIATWIGTGIVAMRSKNRCLAAKEQVIEALSSVEPSLAHWISQIVGQCRTQWGYAVPAATPARAVLRDICARLHTLEQEYFRDYSALPGTSRRSLSETT
jgi:hypothetical protein